MTHPLLNPPPLEGGGSERQRREFDELNSYF